MLFLLHAASYLALVISVHSSEIYSFSFSGMKVENPATRNDSSAAEQPTTDDSSQITSEVHQPPIEISLECLDKQDADIPSATTATEEVESAEGTVELVSCDASTGKWWTKRTCSA